MANGPFHTRDKLKSFWTNISLVSALLLGVTYGNAINPIKPASDGDDLSSACAVAAACSGVSLVFSLSVIVTSVIYLIEVDNCTTERDLADFIDNNAKIVDILTGVFSGDDRAEYISSSVTSVFPISVCLMTMTWSSILDIFSI